MLKSLVKGCLGLIAFAAVIAVCQAQEKKDNPQRWEKAISAFEKQDQESAPPQHATLFLGSSSIRGWKLDKYFPDQPVINRGFGGSQISDSIYYLDRIVFPYKPRAIVFYAGDNDIAAGESPESVTGDFKTFVQKVHGKLPETRILFVAIKPSIRRWKLVDRMRQANEAIQAFAEKQDHVEYVDIFTPMLGEDGQPRKELFANDGLHLNPTGYELWTKVVNAHLKQPAEAK